jgi:hypothetical protein
MKLRTIVAFAILLPVFSATHSANPTVTFEAGSATYPAGTTRVGDDGVTYVSITDNPLGPFFGQSVQFRGVSLGGGVRVYRYRLDFDQEVELNSIVVSGAAWLGFPSDVITLLDSNNTELISVNVPTPPQGSNSFQDVVLDASGAHFSSKSSMMIRIGVFAVALR